MGMINAHIMCMANLTLRIEDSLLKEIRRIAAYRETTVNRMIRDFLLLQTDKERRAHQHEIQLNQLMEAFEGCDWHGKVPPLIREKLHER